MDDARRLVAALRLQRLTVPNRLRRVGPKADGGYVVFDALSRGLLSYGVGTNVDFEYELAPLEEQKRKQE